MQDLTLVGVHDDGEHLVLTDATGQKYRVRVDEPLRAAVRRDRARLGQLQVEADGLRPREIQARIRSGQTAEEVAAAARIPIEHVRRFEGPVLAEREFVAGQARNVRLRRPGSGMTSSTLGELVQQRLGQREADDADTAWDAWREEDGAWVVCLSFHAGSTRRHAHWTYDTQLRHVSARDDEARWFIEEERTEIPGTQRRLTPIRDARDLRDPIRDVIRDRGAETDDGRPADRYVPDRYANGRYATDHHGADRHGADRQGADRQGADRYAEARNAEEYPEEHRYPDRYENARYGEDRFREDPFREDLYGEDRPVEVRRATIDLLDTLRERRGRRQHLAPADPVTGATDAVDDPAETLRPRAGVLGDPSSSRPTYRREDTPDPDLARPPGDDEIDVIELPDDEEPARHGLGVPAAPGARGGTHNAQGARSTQGARSKQGVGGAQGARGTQGVSGGMPVPAAGARSDRPMSGERGATTTRTTPERATVTERPAAFERAIARTASAGQQTGVGKRQAERSGDPGPRETEQRSTGSRDSGGQRGAGSRRPGTRSGMPAVNAPAPGPPSTGREAAGRGAGGHKPSPRYPSSDKPPAPPSAPARDRQATGPVDGADPAERSPSTTRRNKRASVPSWDDIVFGSRRE
jgi:hypothetical protein